MQDWILLARGERQFHADYQIDSFWILVVSGKEFFWCVCQEVLQRLSLYCKRLVFLRIRPHARLL